jgi:hypothetical protein
MGHRVEGAAVKSIRSHRRDRGEVFLDGGYLHGSPKKSSVRPPQPVCRTVILTYLPQGPSAPVIWDQGPGEQTSRRSARVPAGVHSAILKT